MIGLWTRVVSAIMVTRILRATKVSGLFRLELLELLNVKMVAKIFRAHWAIRALETAIRAVIGSLGYSIYKEYLNC